MVPFLSHLIILCVGAVVVVWECSSEYYYDLNDSPMIWWIKDREEEEEESRMRDTPRFVIEF